MFEISKIVYTQATLWSVPRVEIKANERDVENVFSISSFDIQPQTGKQIIVLLIFS